MDQIGAQIAALATVFLSPTTLLICLAVYVMSYVVRKVVETTWKEARTNRYWRELGAPFCPIAMGVSIAFFANAFVWPEVVGQALVGRVIYGAICGFFSAHTYSRVRSWINSRPANKDGTTSGHSLIPLPVIESLPPMADDPPPSDSN
jgi:hypothetical protein